MKAKVFLAISMIALSVTGVSAQSKIVYGGLSLPNGAYSEYDLDKYYNYDGKEGGAGKGFNVGFKYVQPFSDSKLNWFLSAELLYNGLNSDLKDEFEEKYDPESVKYETYFNVPVMGGINYSLADLSPDVSLWVEMGIGVNCRIMSKFNLEAKNGSEYDVNYERSFCFAYQFGGGLKINNRYIVGLSYYDLGSDKIRGEKSYKGNSGLDEKIKTKKELSTTTLAVRVGYIF